MKNFSLWIDIGPVDTDGQTTGERGMYFTLDISAPSKLILIASSKLREFSLQRVSKS
jgi:hypothetical protein